MQLQIISPLRLNTYDIAWIELNTSVGNFVIQKGHAPTLLVLKAGDEMVFRLKDGKQEVVDVGNGIAEITRDKVVVVLS